MQAPSKPEPQTWKDVLSPEACKKLHEWVARMEIKYGAKIAEKRRQQALLESKQAH